MLVSEFGPQRSSCCDVNKDSVQAENQMKTGSPAVCHNSTLRGSQSPKNIDNLVGNKEVGIDEALNPEYDRILCEDKPKRLVSHRVSSMQQSKENSKVNLQEHTEDEVQRDLLSLTLDEQHSSGDEDGGEGKGSPPLVVFNENVSPPNERNSSVMESGHLMGLEMQKSKSIVVEKLDS